MAVMKSNEGECLGWTGLGVKFHAPQQTTLNVVKVSGFFGGISFNVERMMILRMVRYVYNKVHRISISGFQLHQAWVFRDNEKAMCCRI